MLHLSFEFSSPWLAQRVADGHPERHPLAAAWVRRPRRPVISAPGLDGAPPHLLARLSHLEQRVR